ncbi:hypothetical protein HAX54_026028 [Datura stramonium]|uniref:NB-ARC domain-containing protein n=1 Tax=Datura stramonium TaxID=4076 RepID=A0ABS8V0V1_DATST|nr:hypothetical protein [Datura stramonium]
MSSERLQQLFDFLNFPKTSIDRVMLFTRERDFQDIFISLQSFTDEPNMLDVSQKIQTLFQDAAFDLSTLYLTEYFDLYASEIHDPYSPLYVSETEDVSMKLKLLLNFVCFVLERFIEPPQSPTMNEEIVGFEDVIDKLRDQLIRCTKGRDIISVVGMPGLGKTTLAYRLYSDSITREIAEESIDNTKKLHDLRTLSTPCFSCVQEVGIHFEKTPNLRNRDAKSRVLTTFKVLCTGIFQYGLKLEDSS